MQEDVVLIIQKKEVVYVRIREVGKHGWVTMEPIVIPIHMEDKILLFLLFVVKLMMAKGH